jgi:hypothetical protein
MRARCIVLLFPACIACAGLPRISPAGEKEKNEIIAKVRSPFLNARCRLVHSIDGTLPGGAKAAMIGILIADPGTGYVRFTLMSIEGLVLLDAEYDGKIVIKRGIGPLASPDLVMGMACDIRLILFRPTGTLAEAGTLPNGERVCRYVSNERMVDVIMKDSAAELNLYDASSKLIRNVRYYDFRRDGIPRKIDLTAAGIFGYSLRLDLIEAAPESAK